MNTWKELLDQGQKNFNDANSLTGLVVEDISDTHFRQLKEINKYMYTTYSTNPGDFLLSIEGIIHLSTFHKIETSLCLKGYYFIACNPLTKEKVGENLMPKEDYDPSMNKTTYIEKCIPTSKKYYLTQWWMRLCSTGKESIMANYSMPIHFLDFDDPDNFLPSDETLGYVNHNLFSGQNPLISIIIEDPVVARISLYRELLTMLKSI
jgi:hypothetical protein